MKKIILIAVLFSAVNGYAQDVIKIKKHIDSLVAEINQTYLKTKYDTVMQNYPEVGLNLKTYLTIVTDGKELKKYVNKVNTFSKEGGVTKEILSTNTFYYNLKKIIKVEESVQENTEVKHVNWYYSDDKPLYNTSKSDKAEERAKFLLTLSKDLMKKF